MSGRKGYQQKKDSEREGLRETGLLKKSEDETGDSKVRVVQDNLVFVSGIPSGIAEKELLQTDIYFGRYGKVLKIIVNPFYPFKKCTNYQAYVTYESELDASLAIAALDNYIPEDRPLKASYGTTKYCTFFLRGLDCPNNECFYLHKLDKKRQINNGDTRYAFRQQNDRAIDLVCRNLQVVVERVLDSNIDHESQGFPSLMEVIDYLIQNKILSERKVDDAFAVVRKARVMLAQNKKQQKVVLQTKEEPGSNSIIVKCSSLSTMCSPNKNGLYSSEELSSESKRIGDGRGQIASLNPQKKTQQKLKQTMTNGQSKQMGIQSVIERLILKELLKSSNSECKSRFLKDVTANRDECTKIKGIVQKYLIMSY